MLEKNKNDQNKPEINEEQINIRINTAKSGIAEFTKRPIATEEEMEEFEEYIDDEVKDEEMEESLNEIYQDDNGDMVDVKKLVIKKKRGIVFWFFSLILFTGFFAAIGYAGYFFLYEQPGSDATAIEFSIEGDDEVIAGEEFFYTIRYYNPSNVIIRNARIEANYPDNYVVLDSDPVAAEKNNIWLLDSIAPRQKGSIRIRGKMMGVKDETGIILASITYTPENFSSEFKKSTSITSTIKDIGLEFEFDYLSSALVGENNDMKLYISAKENNYISSFRISMEPDENVEIINTEKQVKEGDEEMVDYEVIRPGVWEINEVDTDKKYLPIEFRFDKKNTDNQELIFHFEQTDDGTVYKQFYEEKIGFEVMKSDLNLTLIINGEREDQGINFGDTLNYSIVYKNKGETSMKDVVIMAVLNSELLDWGSLSMTIPGTDKGKTISWTKEEIPELEELRQEQEGTIDFSIKVLEASEIRTDIEYEVQSYAQFSVGNIEEFNENEDNRSNLIINKINSDLKLKEEIRYFNEDNIPVGTGPHPPKVGEETSYKVFWDLTNNLHELNNLNISVKLPEHVAWDDKGRASVGVIEYNSDTHQIEWNIGRLPISVFLATAEFHIKIIPTEADKNKIMVLLPGTEVKGEDVETQAILDFTTKAKTTKLEDDEIATGDGRVE